MYEMFYEKKEKEKENTHTQNEIKIIHDSQRKMVTIIIIYD